MATRVSLLCSLVVVLALLGTGRVGWTLGGAILLGLVAMVVGYKDAKKSA